MNSETFPTQTETVGGRLTQRVAIMSAIAIIALVAVTALALWGTLQGVQGQLNDAGFKAARTFDEFLGNVKGDLAATSDMLATTGDMSEVLRRALGRQPTIFELVLVDESGQVLAQRRRVGAGETTIAEQPWLATVQAGQTYVGPVDYGEYGVPFVDVAITVNDARDEFWATLLARLDLTALWDTAIRLQVGETGYVYITDETGQLLAFRNLQLVKSGVSLQDLANRTPQAIAEPGFDVYSGASGKMVIASSVPLETVSWYTVVEQPASEALEPFLLQSIFPLVLLLLVGATVFSTVRFTRRRIALPLRLLREGVVALSEGHLEHRIDLQTQDEFGALSNTFNTMSIQLQESIDELEQRVAERTRSLRMAADFGRATTSVLDLDKLLRQVVELSRERFDLYYVGLFLLDEQGRFAVLRQGTGAAGQQMVAQEHKLEVGGDSMIGQCVFQGEARIALDIGEEAVYFKNPLLPETRSEMALPLRSRGQVIGAMTVQSVEASAFDEADITVMQMLADQVAVAINNAQLFAEAQTSLEAMGTTQRRYLGQAWTKYLRDRATSGYAYGQDHSQTQAEAVPLGDELLPQVERAMATGRPVTDGDDGEGRGELEHAQGTAPSTLIAPIILRGQPIGALGFREEQGGRQWSDDDVVLAQAISEQFALAAENLRLLDETQRRAAREQLVSQTTARMRESLDLDTVLQTAIREIGEKLDIAEVEVRMGNVEQQSLAER